MKRASPSSFPLTSDPPRLRILVVDDDETTLMLVGRLLGREGYAVLTSSSAATALALLRAEPFDVLLTDLVMPLMSGLELAAAARQLRTALRIVIMSGQARTDDAAEDIVWLDKPLDIDQLLALMATAPDSANKPAA